MMPSSDDYPNKKRRIDTTRKESLDLSQALELPVELWEIVANTLNLKAKLVLRAVSRQCRKAIPFETVSRLQYPGVEDKILSRMFLDFVEKLKIVSDQAHLQALVKTEVEAYFVAIYSSVKRQDHYFRWLEEKYRGLETVIMGLFLFKRRITPGLYSAILLKSERVLRKSFFNLSKKVSTENRINLANKIGIEYQENNYDDTRFLYPLLENHFNYIYRGWQRLVLDWGFMTQYFQRYKNKVSVMVSLAKRVAFPLDFWNLCMGTISLTEKDLDYQKKGKDLCFMLGFWSALVFEPRQDVQREISRKLRRVLREPKVRRNLETYYSNRIPVQVTRFFPNHSGGGALRPNSR